MLMKRTNKTSVAYALSVLLALALFFTGLVLKLCGLISLSWWWITAPLWGLLLGTLLVLGALFLCVIILSAAAERRRS